jgi:hypothetical protein
MSRYYDPEVYEFEAESYDPYAEFNEVGQFETDREAYWSGETPRRRPRRRGEVLLPGENPELRTMLDEIRRGNRDRNKLTDMFFHRRHPERRGAPLRRNEGALIREWRSIRALVDAALVIDALSRQVREMTGR